MTSLNRAKRPKQIAGEIGWNAEFIPRVEAQMTNDEWPKSVATPFVIRYSSFQSRLREMIELQPIRMQHVDHFIQALEAVRLAEVGSSAQFIRAADVSRIVRMRQHDHRQARESESLANGAQNLKAVHPRHAQIEEQ